MNGASMSEHPPPGEGRGLLENFWPVNFFFPETFAGPGSKFSTGQECRGLDAGAACVMFCVLVIISLPPFEYRGHFQVFACQEMTNV
jgi:hypothetical protein